MENEINVLREYYNQLGLFKKLFFPGKFAEKLKSLTETNVHDSQKVMSLCESLFNDTNKFSRWLFSGLGAFSQSPKVNAYQKLLTITTITPEQKENIFNKIVIHPDPLIFVDHLIQTNFEEIKEQQASLYSLQESNSSIENKSFSNQLPKTEDIFTQKNLFPSDSLNILESNPITINLEKEREQETVMANTAPPALHSSQCFQDILRLWGNGESEEGKKQINNIISKLNVSQFSQLCHKVLGWGQKSLLKFLLKTQHATQLPFLEKKFFIDIIDASLLYAQIDSFQMLEKNYPELIDETVWARKLREHPNRLKIQTIMKGFYSSEGTTPILKSIHIQLILAAKHQHKQSLIAVFEDNNIDSFCQKLSTLITQNNLSLQLPFTYYNNSDNHCISGIINIVENTIEVGIIEPTGVEEIISENVLTTNDFIFKIKSFLPQAAIYCSVERIQHDKYSCTLMAVDNALHLRNADSYIAPSHRNFFDYLKQNVLSTHTFDRTGTEIEIKLTTLPLRFLRMMQSLISKSPKDNNLSFFTHSGMDTRIAMHKNSLELSYPINKRGETVQQSLNKHIVTDSLNTTFNKRINKRIEAKLKKYRELALDFLLSHDMNYVLAATQEFTPDKVFEKIEQQVNAQQEILAHSELSVSQKIL
ncbi:hypothetical protein [Legionella fairfieldensis]|uniref:hypothetical protein n=1 Tax=Legionella fairfieldensis TaxID=45064 RepID=UPI000AADD1E8|nr:hypothetical protein [Legionella fairfieldensis]